MYQNHLRLYFSVILIVPNTRKRVQVNWRRLLSLLSSRRRLHRKRLLKTGSARPHQHFRSWMHRVSHIGWRAWVITLWFEIINRIKLQFKVELQDVISKFLAQCDLVVMQIRFQNFINRPQHHNDIPSCRWNPSIWVLWLFHPRRRSCADAGESRWIFRALKHYMIRHILEILRSSRKSLSSWVPPRSSKIQFPSSNLLLLSWPLTLAILKQIVAMTRNKFIY